MGFGFLLGVLTTLTVIAVCSFFDTWQRNHESRERENQTKRVEELLELEDDGWIPL